MFKSKANATLVGMVAYLLLILAGPVGKLLGLGHLARLPWLKATALLWGPWLLSLVFWLLLGLVALGEKLFKRKIYNDLTVPGS